MSLVNRNSLFDLDHYFDNGWAPIQQSLTRQSAFAPRVDVHERDNAYEISAELPGVDKKDVQVSLENGVLTIEAESKQEDVEKQEGRVIRQERRYGKFVRSFDLAKQVHEGDITANFENGVLKVVAPKLNPEHKGQRRIEIQ